MKNIYITPNYSCSIILKNICNESWDNSCIGWSYITNKSDIYIQLNSFIIPELQEIYRKTRKYLTGRKF